MARPTNLSKAITSGVQKSAITPKLATSPLTGGIPKTTGTPKTGTKSGTGITHRPGFAHKPNFQHAQKHGVKFGHGYFYRGGHHRHWTKSFFWGQHRAWCYWCPSTCGWFYWQAQHNCFLPVSCIQTFPAMGAAPITGLPIQPPEGGDPILDSFPPNE
jgi:hypothetical protein